MMYATHMACETGSSLLVVFIFFLEAVDAAVARVNLAPSAQHELLAVECTAKSVRVVVG